MGPYMEAETCDQYMSPNSIYSHHTYHIVVQYASHKDQSSKMADVVNINIENAMFHVKWVSIPWASYLYFVHWVCQEPTLHMIDIGPCCNTLALH